MRISHYFIPLAAVCLLLAAYGCKKDRGVRTRKWHHFHYHSVASYDSFNQVISQYIDSSRGDELFGVTGLGSSMVIAKDKTYESKFVFDDRIEYAYSTGHFVGGVLYYYPAPDSIYIQNDEYYGPTATPIAPAIPYKIEKWNDSYWTY